MTAFVDETGLRTEYQYDALNQLVAETSPSYETVISEYNPAGERISETDAEGITRTWAYDLVGEVISETDGLGNEISFEYDIRDNIVEVNDQRGNVTTYTYDILDRQLSRTNPLGQTIGFEYDKRDNLVALTREDGTVETAIYDGLSRRTAVTTADNGFTYSYDNRGNLTGASDSDSALTLTYDSRHRLLSMETSGGVGPQPATVVSYTYDGNGQRKTASDHLGAVWNYGFDERSRIETLTAPWGTQHTMVYDPAGRRLSLTNTSGRATTAEYADDRLNMLQHSQDGVTFSEKNFGYAEDGAVSVIRDLLDPSESRSLTYDNINRLTMVSEGLPASDGGVPVPVEDYAYDPSGNRTSSHISRTYVVDDHNRLLEDSTYTYGYDVKGNRISRTSKADGVTESYTYDSMNLLTGMTSSDGTSATYAYDALGRRIAKTVNGVTTAYVYDVGSLRDVTTHDLLLEYQDDILIRRWLHGQEIDEPIGFEAYTTDTTAGAGTAYAIHADRQGSVIAVTDQTTSTLVAGYDYDAFGAQNQNQGQFEQPYGFTGRLLDPETGLYYYRARYYDPGTGRFTRSDPFGFAAGDTNLYAYTWNDPANWSDPSGLTSSSEHGRLSRFSVGLAQSTTRVVGNAAKCVARRVATAIAGMARVLATGRDITRLRVRAKPGCRTQVTAPRPCGCQMNPLIKAGSHIAAGFALGSAFSFPEGTEVLTPSGKVAIETLREGDLVVARDEDTGVSGIFPVTAVMGRQAPGVLWLTLADAEGQTSRLGVTSEHPLYVADRGWLTAGEIAPGDAIRDADLREITVLVVETDDTLHTVHNLEIADAHTYFVGDFEVWAHNSGRPPARWWRALLDDCKTSSVIRGFLQQQQNAGIPPSRWRLPPGFDQGHYPANRGRHNMCSRPENSRDNRRRPSITGGNTKWR